MSQWPKKSIGNDTSSSLQLLTLSSSEEDGGKHAAHFVGKIQRISLLKDTTVTTNDAQIDPVCR